MSARNTFIFLFMLMALGLNVGAARGMDSEAMVMEVKGQVRITGVDRKGEAVQLLDWLDENDELFLSKGASLVLEYFSSGLREQIKGPLGVHVGKGRSTVILAEGGAIVSSRPSVTPPKAKLSAEQKENFGTITLRSVKPGRREVNMTFEQYLTAMAAKESEESIISRYGADSDEGLVRLSLLYSKQGEYQKLIAIAERLHTRHPNNDSITAGLEALQGYEFPVQPAKLNVLTKGLTDAQKKSLFTLPDTFVVSLQSIEGRNALVVEKTGQGYQVALPDGRIVATYPKDAWGDVVKHVSRQAFLLRLPFFLAPQDEMQGVRLDLLNAGETLKAGRSVGFRITAEQDGYPMLLHISPHAQISVLYPYDAATGKKLRAGNVVELPNYGVVQGPFGLDCFALLLFPEKPKYYAELMNTSFEPQSEIFAKLVDIFRFQDGEAHSVLFIPSVNEE